jgi:putative ATP-dependent endonuclease of OLD family
LVRRFITSTKLERSRVERDLLNDINQIYLGDSKFTQILCQENEDDRNWEIYLREDTKGDIRLSQSGSSLKTVFIITAFLRLQPNVRNNQGTDNLMFAIEEPENNLHPALLRRLLQFLAHQRINKNFSLIITTHSPICIDWAARRDDATILHVRKEDDRTVCQNVFDYAGRVNILDDLDARGSDLLQANGIIWVEGPSDAVYLRHWIDLASDRQLEEGTHYSFAYYGGRILSHFDALPADERNDKIRMLLINRNVAVVMDSDRRPNASNSRKPSMRLNDTKKRVIKEVKVCAGLSWVTEGKEIENYVPDTIWQTLVGTELSIENEFTAIPDLKKIKSKASSKVALAHKAVALIDVAALDRLDLKKQLAELCDHIRHWNLLDKN